MNESQPRSATSDREEELQALVVSYEARLDEIALLIARVRHEINNPLTGVLGQAQLLLREDLNDRLRQRVLTIEELAHRMRDTVGKLREVQRSIGTKDGKGPNSDDFTLGS